MAGFKEIKSEDFNYSPFKLIGKDWMLISAEKDSAVNTMTAAWGGMGVIWGKDAVFCVIRPQRYTKAFVEDSEYFSLTFFEDSFKKKLTYLGKVSGRDENKIEKTGLTIACGEMAPYFEEAKIVIICKKMYAQDYKPECFIDKESEEKWYPLKDYHTMYIGEITKILVK